MKQTLNVARLESLTDAIFAIAMTILVLNFNLPEGMQPSHLWSIIKTVILSNLFIYTGSFIILGTQWVAITVQHAYLKAVNRPYLWINILYLLVICLIPFSSNMVINYIQNPISIVCLAINLVLAMIGQLVMCWGGYRSKLYNESYNAIIHRAIVKRIFLAPPFYIAAMIAAYWNTDVAFILLSAPPLLYIFPGKIDKVSE